MAQFEIRVDGDLAKAFARLRATQPGAMLTISEQLCEETLNLVSEGFAAGTDPYGDDWNAPNDLQITGGIRRYARGRAGADGWEVHATDKKAIWHHDPQPRKAWGRKKLPTRLQVPTPARGLPAKWLPRLVEALEDTIHALLR